MIAVVALLAAALASAQSWRLENPANAIPRFTLHSGQWHSLNVDGRFQVWLRHDHSRYIVHEHGREPREYRHEVTGRAVLPSMSPWEEIWPQPLPGGRMRYLGHIYIRDNDANAPTPPPANPRIVNLRPDLWLGPPSNAKQQDETRRYDGSDYTYIPFAKADYETMAQAGITVVKAVGPQQSWAEDLGLFFWGPHEQLPYPELLYRSQYLGPALFLDEPAVGTRDHDLRPKLANDPAFRKSITAEAAFDAYRAHYTKSITAGPAQVLMRTLKARKDIDLGTMSFAQRNVYNWETMPETAAWALSQDPHVPEAMVFEPPGRIGTRRTLPEWNMAYGTQFRIDDMRVLPSIVFGFLRGAARLNHKKWGVSIYGAVERADAPYWLTHAYDLGAERFFFWDNYQLACVPFGEILALSRHLRNHARQHPRGAVEQATRAILLPPGYGLGHVQTGRGNLWGIGELNLERRNHRAVMSRFFAEIERSLREGVAFDLFWDIAGQNLNGYADIVRVPTTTQAPDHPRTGGPQLSVRVSDGAAIAHVKQTQAPIYYTLGADPSGVLHNALVLWELYGPNEEDYLFLLAKDMRPDVRWHSATEAEVRISLPKLTRGRYRLRAATVDIAGRSTVVWTEWSQP